MTPVQGPEPPPKKGLSLHSIMDPLLLPVFKGRHGGGLQKERNRHCVGKETPFPQKAKQTEADFEAGVGAGQAYPFHINPWVLELGSALKILHSCKILLPKLLCKGRGKLKFKNWILSPVANESFSKLESFGKLAFSKLILEGHPLASRVCRVWWRRTQLPGSRPLPSTLHKRDLQVPQRPPRRRDVRGFGQAWLPFRVALGLSPWEAPLPPTEWTFKSFMDS